MAVGKRSDPRLHSACTHTSPSMLESGIVEESRLKKSDDVGCEAEKIARNGRDGRLEEAGGEDEVRSYYHGNEEEAEPHLV